MASIVNTAGLPGKRFEGYLYGVAPVSFFVSATQPVRGPKLHKHPYTEVFVLHAGTLTFVVGDETIEATAGQIVIVPPGRRTSSPLRARR